MEITPVSIARAARSPDRAGEAVVGVVRDPDRLGFVGERDQCGDGAEDLLARDPLLGPRLDEGGREPEAPAVRRLPAEEGLAFDEARHRVAVRGRDERPHLRPLVLWVADLDPARR